MINLIELQNTVINTHVKLTQDASSPFTLGKLDVGKVEGLHNTYMNYDGVGSNVSSTNLGSRTVNIDFYVWDNTFTNNGSVSSQMATYTRTKNIERNKKILNSLINPFQDVIIKIGNYFLRGKPYSNIVYSNNYLENNEIKCRGSISILCSMPMYQLIEPAATIIAGVEGGFMFPFILKPGGVHMGVKKSFSLISVENLGDISVGGRLIIRALGTVINPEFNNVMTNERMKLNITLQQGDIVTIDTRVNNESITGIIGGVEQNLYKYFDYDDEFFIYETGITLLNYSAENETYKNMDARIELNTLHYNIETE